MKETRKPILFDKIVHNADKNNYTLTDSTTGYSVTVGKKALHGRLKTGHFYN